MNEIYSNQPELYEYFKTLPFRVRDKIITSNAEISTLGELMMVAAHFEKMEG